MPLDIFRDNSGNIVIIGLIGSPAHAYVAYCGDHFEVAVVDRESRLHQPECILGAVPAAKRALRRLRRVIVVH